MLEIQNSIQNKSENKQILKNTRESTNDIAARFLSRKFLNIYNIKDPSRKISNHLKRIFLYYFRYKVTNIDLIISCAGEKRQKYEFKVNLFCETACEQIEVGQASIELISIDSFFYKNIKSIII